MFPFHRTRISTLSITCFYIIKYTYPFHRKRAFVPHFVGVYVYAGTINRPLRLLTDCQNVADGLPKHCEHSTKCQRTIREMRNEHTVRRRGRFIAPVFTKYQFCECLSSFYGCLHICGHDKSTPTAADGLR